MTALFAHLVFKYHPLMRLYFTSEQMETSFMGLLFGMTLAGSQFFSALFYETVGIAPPECEQLTPDAWEQVAVGLGTGLFKALAAMTVVYFIKRTSVYVRFHHEKWLRLWWWSAKGLLWKVICFSYLTFCTFYVACFCGIVSEQTLHAYENTSATALGAIFLLKPGLSIIPIYLLMLLERWFGLRCIRRFFRAFPDLTDFSFESSFAEAAKKLHTSHSWLEAAPEAGAAAMLLASMRRTRAPKNGGTEQTPVQGLVERFDTEPFSDLSDK